MEHMIMSTVCQEGYVMIPSMRHYILDTHRSFLDLGRVLGTNERNQSRCCHEASLTSKSCCCPIYMILSLWSCSVRSRDLITYEFVPLSARVRSESAI